MNERWDPMTANVSHFRPTKRSREVWTPAERKDLARLWGEGMQADAIGDLLGKSSSQVYNKANQMGLPPRRGGSGKRLKVGRTKKRIHRADPTGQRRKTRVAAASGPHVRLEPHDPRLRAGITIFPTTVRPASKIARLLKSGHNSYKIGKTVAKGRLRGAPIFTLTLEERATCPPTCLVWDTCYGNNMPFPHRIWDDGTLTKRLWGELASIAAEHDRFLVRLHVLGDFASVEYVDFWRSALDEFAGLNIFGFTARRPPDPIGIALVELVRDHYERCRLRFSGLRYEEDGAVVIDRGDTPVGVLCPAEDDPDRCCATCALCWHSNRTISFLRH